MNILTSNEIAQVSGGSISRVGIKLIDWAVSGAAWEFGGWAFSQPRRSSSGGQMNIGRRSNMFI